MVDPVENLSMPHKTSFPVEDPTSNQSVLRHGGTQVAGQSWDRWDIPMILIREIQESAWNTTFLEDIKDHDTIRDRKTEVEIIMNDKVRRGPFFNVIERVPSVVIVIVIPKCAVELFEAGSGLGCWL
jgi:hypothetical protein